MLFSIIIPVYNVEDYLHECVDSVLNQTCQDFEIILVDDGSTDRSSSICDEYKEKDRRVKVIHKENGGYFAWIAALEIVEGEYVGSIDSDDYVEQNLLQTLKEKIEQTQSEVFVFGYQSFGNDTPHKFQINLEEGLYTRDEIEARIIPRLINEGCFENRNAMYLSRVNKFVKRELLLRNKKFYQKDIVYGEDNMWTIPNVLCAESIYVWANYFPYYYRFNSCSTTHRYHEDLWGEFTRLNNHILDVLKALDREDIFLQIERDAVFFAAIAINNLFAGLKEKNVIIKEIKRIVYDPLVIKGVRHMDRARCTLKEKINLFLIRGKMYRMIYYIKKFQKG